MFNTCLQSFTTDEYVAVGLTFVVVALVSFVIGYGMRAKEVAKLRGFAKRFEEPVGGMKSP